MDHKIKTAKSSITAIFALNVPDATGQISITITNITGITVKSLTGANKQGSVNWDTQGLAAGGYVYEAGSERGIISKGKLVVMP